MLWAATEAEGTFDEIKVWGGVGQCVTKCDNCAEEWYGKEAKC